MEPEQILSELRQRLKQSQEEYEKAKRWKNTTAGRLEKYEHTIAEIEKMIKKYEKKEN